MKTKLVSLFVIFIFILGAFPVLAQDARDTNTDSEKLEQEFREKIETEEGRQEIRTRIKDGEVEVKVRNLLEKTDARQRSEMVMKLNFEEIRAFQLERLQKVLENCESEECKQAIQKNIDRVKGELSERDAERLRKLMAERTDSARELHELRIKREFREFNEDGKKRVLTKIDVKTIESLDGEFEESKKEFTRLKSQIKDKKGDVQFAKQYVGSALKVTKKKLESFKTQVENSEELSETEAQEILNDVNEEIGSVETVEEQLENAETESEVKEVAEEAKETIERVKQKMRGHGTTHLVNKGCSLTVQLARLDHKLDIMKERALHFGVDPAQFNTERFEQHKEEAIAACEAAKAAQDHKERMDNIHKVREAVKNARVALQEDVLVPLREAKLAVRDVVPSNEEVEASVEVETETESNSDGSTTETEGNAEETNTV